MLAYRRDPRVFEHRINRNVLHIWSDIDYVLQAAEIDRSVDSWAKTADVFSNLDPAYRLDLGGEPYCVIKRKSLIVVLEIDPAEKTVRTRS